MELIYCFSLVSVILIGYGLYKLLYYNYAKKNYSVAIGHIKDFENVTVSDGDGNLNTVKYPLIQYEVTGRTYKKRGWGKVIQNKPWNVYYNPSDPLKCILEGDNGFTSIILGLAFLIIPIIIFLNK